MRRFFLKDREDVQGDSIIIKGEDFLHIQNSLRMKVGEEISISDGHSKEYLTKIDSFEKDAVVLKIYEEKDICRETIKVNLFQSIPKGDKMDLIVQKVTELGINEITTFVSERTIVKLDSKKEEKKRQRWEKIAFEAAKQSKRYDFPKVNNSISFKELLKKISSDELFIVLWENESKTGLKAVLNENKSKIINIIVGPEGGLSEAEVEAMIDKGAKSGSLGKRILRTETAPIASLSAIMYHYDELG